MSEIVPRDKDGQITLSKRPRRKIDVKALLPSLDVPAAELRVVDMSDARFKPVVSADGWLRKQRNRCDTVVLIAGMSQCFIIPLGLAGGLAAPAGLNFVLAGIAAALELAWLPAGVFSARVHRAKRANFKAFLQWLHGRYGVTLNAKQKLPKVLSSKFPLLHEPNQTMVIEDDLGKVFELRWVILHKNFTLTEKEGQGEPLTLIQAKKPEVSMSTGGNGWLSPQLRVLHRQIQERLTVLADRSLSPESDHVVGRAKRDVVKIIALYGDLVKFNAVDATQEASVVATFQSLIEELTEVIKKETAFSLAQLTVETTYVAARQPRKGIELKKP